MRRHRSSSPAIVLALIAFPFGVQGQVGPSLVQEARSFMESYQRDLKDFVVDSIVARYDPRGAVVIVAGSGGARTFAQIEAAYRAGRTGPAYFEWQDLEFLQVASDAVLVRGEFRYQTTAASTELRFSYLAILAWDGARFGILFEREEPTPPNPTG